jgi:hypothetical protein
MGKGDIEAGMPQGLYPSMIESTELRWGFIRKVYTIVSIQLLITAVFASIFIFFPPARNFARYNDLGFLLLFGAFIFTFISKYLFVSFK